MANPSFIPEGYIKKEVKRDEPKPSFIPSGYKRIDSETYKDPTKTAGVDSQYVPELLRGTEFEGDVSFLENKLFTQGAEGFDTAVSLDRGKLAWSLQAFKGLTPDEAAEVQAIARVRNVPFDTVNNNKKVYKENDKARQVFNSLFEVGADGKPKYPITARMLSNPTKMAIAKDDVETLTKIEGLITAYNRGPLESLAHEAKEGLKDISRGLISTFSVQQHQKIFELEDDLKSADPNIVKSAQKEKASRELILRIADTAKNSDFLRGVPLPRVSGAQGYLNDVARVGPQVATSVIATKLFGPAGGLAVISGQIFGQTYDELRAKEIGHEKALKGAAFNTVFQAAIEVIPANRLATLFKSTGIKTVVKNFFLHGFAEMGAEFLQEWPEAITDIWGDAQKEGRTLEEAKQIFKERAPEIFMKGIYAGQVVAPYAFLPLAIKLPSDISKARQTKKDLALFDAEMQIAEESKLKERSPEEYEEMSRAQHVAGGIAEDILIPKEIIESYHQDDYVGLKNTMEELEIVDQVSEADVTGVFKVSRSRFAQRFAGTDLAKAVRDHIRFTAEGLSSVEAAKLNEQLPKALEEMQNQYNQLIKDNALPVQALRLREQLMMPKQAFVIRDANGDVLASSVNLEKAQSNLVKINEQLPEGETPLNITEERGFGLSAIDADTNMAIAIEGAKQLSKQSNETLDQWWARVNPTIKVSNEIMTFEGETIDPDTFEQTDPLGFYSKLRVGVQDINFKKMPAKELIKRVKEIPGIKQDELDFTGIEELLESTEGKVSKEDIVKFLERGGLQLEEVVETRQADYTGQQNTTYDSYVLPGGTNYRIVRLVLPKKFKRLNSDEINELRALGERVKDTGLSGVESERYEALKDAHNNSINEREYTSEHWQEANVLAHIRLNDRIDADGNKVLFIEEIQSDWHRDGARRGYSKQGVPDAPFKGRSAWSLLAFKRILNMASVEGYDAVAWTSGDQQVDRYDLSKQVDSVFWNPQDETFFAYKDGEEVIFREYVREEDLDEIIGKEAAKNILAQDLSDYVAGGEVIQVKKLEDDELKIGGEGLKSLYDKVLPNAVQRYVKKLDKKSKVGTTKISTAGPSLEKLNEINLDNFEQITTVGDTDYYSDPDVSGWEYQVNKRSGMYSLNSSDGEGYGTFDSIEEMQATIDKINESIREDNQFVGGVTIGQFYETDRLSDRSFYAHENGLSYVEMDTGVSSLWNRITGEQLGDFNSRSELKKALAKQISTEEVWSLPITKKLREEVLKGQTLFQEQGIRRGNVQFTDSGAVINLFGSANLSSFLHEMSHIFTNEQRQIINSGNGDQQFQDDFNALVDFAGGELNRAGHEKIARGFERYLKEGKAPSIQLTSAFRRIKDWMDAIYKVVAGSPIDVEISDEVRAIFDRLLADRKAIAEANEYYSVKPSMQELIKLPQSVVADLGDKDKKAEQTSIEKQTKASLAAYVQAEGGREAITKRVTKEIEGQQVYKAIKNAQDLGGIEPTEIEALRGADAVKLMRQRHKGSVFKKLEDKGAKDYRGLVLEYGGIKASTLTADDRRLFKESGASPRVYRKDGQGLDQLAQQLESEYLLIVPEGRTAADYLKELILDKAPIENDVGFLDDIEGESLSTLALENNYESEEALLDDMLAAQAKGKAIEAKTREVLKAREEEIKRQLLAGEAVNGEESFHSEERLTLLVAQAEALAGKLYREEAKAVDRLATKIIRDAATDRISILPVWKAIRYNDYSAAEKRYAKKAQDFLKENNLVEAHEAIKYQAMNHAMVLASIKARDAKTKIDARYKSKKINPRLKNAEIEYRDNAAALIGTYDLNRTIAVPETLTPLKSLDEILESLIPEWITNRVKPQNYRNHRDLPFGQFVQLDKAIGEILSSGTEVLHESNNEDIKTITDLEEAILKNMEKLPTLKVRGEFDFLGAKTFLGPKLSLAEGFMDTTKKLELISERIDNYSFEKNKILGPLRSKVREGVDKEGDYNDKKQATLTAAEKHLKGLYGSLKRLKQVHGSYAFDIPGVPTTEDMKKAGYNKWTAERVVSFVLNMGNAGNFAALENSYGYNPTQVKAIVRQLNKKELRAIQGIWDVTESLFPELDAAHFEIYNHHLEKVEAQELILQASDGEITLRGGYYPLMFDHNLNFQAEGQKLTEDAKRDDIMANRNMNVVRSAKPKNGATFHRTKGHSLPPMLAFSEVWFTHINDVIRYTTHSKYLRDMNRLIKRPGFRNRVMEVAGKDIYKGISSSISYQALPERRRPDGKADAIMDGLRRTATTAILGLKAVVGLKQRVSQINAIEEIGWYYLGVGYASTDIRNSILGLGNGEKYQNMLKLSKFMRLREGKVSREISDFTGKMNPLVKKFEIKGWEFSWKDVQDHAFDFILMNDRATVGVVWYGAFAKGMAENSNLNEKEQINKAIQYADIIVQNTQPSSIPIDLSEAQRAEGALRLFTAFSTFTIGVYGNRVQFKYRAWRDGAITTRQYLRHHLYDTVLPGMALLAIGTIASRGKWPDKEEYYWAPLMTIISGMPWVRDLSSWKYSKTIGKIPAFEYPNRVVEALDSTRYSLLNNKNWNRALWDIGRAVEVPLGFPALNIVKDTLKTYDNITGSKTLKKVTGSKRR